MKKLLIAAAFVLGYFYSPAAAAGTQTNGRCDIAMAYQISSRVEGAPWSGTAIEFTNGVFMVGYEESEAAKGLAPGDTVMLCPVENYSPCKEGEEGSKLLMMVHLRTAKTWIAGTSTKACVAK